MGVLHVINGPDHGGAEIYALKVIQGLLNKRYVHHLAYSSGGGILSRFQSLPISLFQMSFNTLTFRSPLRGFLTVLRVVQYVKRNGVIILHAHLFEPYIWCCLVSLLTGCPLIRTVVGARADAPRWTRPLEWMCAVLTSRYICFSPASRDEMLGIGVSESKIAVIPNGVDPALLVQMSTDRQNAVQTRVKLAGSPVIGTVGRVNWHKNQSLFIQAAAGAISQVGGICVLDGEGPLKDELRSLACELGLGGQMIFTGWSEDVHALISLFDVFVLSSVTEGVPNVILEAMALGIPVVATDVGGVSSVVRDGQTGLLVPPDDQDEMSRAIIRILDHPTETRKMTSRAREMITKQFSMASVCHQIDGIYRELI